jgi:hypothetical protein
MKRIRLYIDEDAMQQALVVALRARRVDVSTASESGLVNRSDEEHLCYASREGRALYSFNIGDFTALHSQWIARGEAHAGIILAPQQRYSVGEQLRRILHLFAARTAGEMECRLEYLSSWGR